MKTKYMFVLTAVLYTAVYALGQTPNSPNAPRGRRWEVLAVVADDQGRDEQSLPSVGRIRIAMRGGIMLMRLSDAGERLVVLFDAGSGRITCRAWRGDGSVDTFERKISFPPGVDPATMAAMVTGTMPLVFRAASLKERKVGRTKLCGMPCDVFYAKGKEKGTGYKFWRRVKDGLTLRWVARDGGLITVWDTLKIEENVPVSDEELRLPGNQPAKATPDPGPGPGAEPEPEAHVKGKGK